jgi:hypothetical protein
MRKLRLWLVRRVAALCQVPSKTPSGMPPTEALPVRACGASGLPPAPRPGTPRCFRRASAFIKDARSLSALLPTPLCHAICFDDPDRHGLRHHLRPLYPSF